MELSEANSWSYTWSGLNRNVNAAGTAGGARKIVYTVEETGVQAPYTAAVSGSAEKGFVITNSMETGNLAIEKRFDVVPKEEEEPMQALTDIRVEKIWEDQDNRDGNRPAGVTVRLYEDGQEIAAVELNEGNGWQHTFTDLQKYRDGQTIRYSVLEDPVEMYVAEYRGYTIVNRYTPKLTSVSVRKVWNDENNRYGMRPKAIWVMLNNGTAVLLNEENGWFATVSDLPVVTDGKEAEYAWTEQEVTGYRQTEVTVNGTVTTFTNKVIGIPKVPVNQPQPKTPGDTWVIFEEYDTALGGELLINHVGDCFD